MSKNFKQKLKEFFCWEHEYYTVEKHLTLDLVYENESTLVCKFGRELYDYLVDSLRKEFSIHYDWLETLFGQYETNICHICGHIKDGKVRALVDIHNFLEHRQLMLKQKEKAVMLYNERKN